MSEADIMEEVHLALHEKAFEIYLEATIKRAVELGVGKDIQDEIYGKIWRRIMTKPYGLIQEGVFKA